jgi:arginine deiminase
MSSFGSQSMVAPLRRVIVKRPEQAFGSGERIEHEWQRLAYTRPPDLARASEDHARFVGLLARAGADVLYLPEDDRTGLDSLYAHDPVLITDRGAVVFQTGKMDRRGEGPAFADAFRRWDVPILGFIDGPGTAEAGDMVWLDHDTLLVGRGFRTNAAGLQKLSELLSPLGVTVIPVELPYWNGPQDVLHLMSFISLLDADLAVVYRRILPVPLFELLTSRGIQLVDVPEQEYDSLGCNVLAVAPRTVIMASGNPITRSRL